MHRSSTHTGLMRGVLRLFFGFPLSSLYIATLSLAFLGAAAGPHTAKPIVSIYHASEFDWYASNGDALALIFGKSIEESQRQYVLPMEGDYQDAIIAPAIDVHNVELQDFILRDVTIEGSEQLSEASVLGIHNAGMGDELLNNDLWLNYYANEYNPARLDSFPRIPDDLDTTARSRFLPRMRRPGVVADPFPQRRHPFYLTTNKAVRTVVEVDSVSDMVTIRKLVNGKDVQVPLRMTLEEYIRLRYEYEQQRRTETYATSYDTSKASLEEFLKDITEFDIPIPENPLTSIFGDRSRISLRISGQVDINAGFKIESSDQQSVFLNPTQFSPNFRQQVSIRLNGLIGDKLSLEADWSTERTFDYENQLKVRYTGYEDEIVQSVEAGNISLQTPSRLIQGSGALFGIKAEFLFGPLTLTAIASQKKGSDASVNASGGAQENKIVKSAYDYSDNHYFVDVEYMEDDPSALPGEPRNVYEAYYNYRRFGNNNPITLRPELQINDIEIWVSRPSSASAVPNTAEREGIAIMDLIVSDPPNTDGTNQFSNEIEGLLDPNNSVTEIVGLREAGKFLRLEPDEFSFNPVTGIVTIFQNVQDDQIIAAAYRTVGQDGVSGNSDDAMYGTFSSDPRLDNRGPYTDPTNSAEQVEPRLVLKLIKPRNLVPSMEKAWNQKVRSIFSLNARNISEQDLRSLRLVVRQGGQPERPSLLGYPLLQLFGLDYTDNVGGGPDERFDFISGLTINTARGEVIFPTLRPWDTGLDDIYTAVGGGNRDSLRTYLFPAAYDTTKTAARNSDRDKIFLVATVVGGASSRYNLGFNVVQGSVRVTLDGRPLTEGTDFQVNYQVGTVTITNEDALAPDANLNIDYEKQDLFSFASKTLVGARGDLDVGKNSFLGFTFLSQNQQTLSDKVRLGDEPISNTMFGIDGGTNLELPILTEALNTLPFLETKEKSSLNFMGEFAMVMPNENSKPSTIPSDGGAGVAYIDDFEGARTFIPLQTAYSVWSLGSVPAIMPSISDTTTEPTMNQNRARFNWYNIPISGDQSRAVSVQDIWPDRQTAREDQRVTVLDLEFKPLQRGTYNYTPVGQPSAENWGGIMRKLPVNASNLKDGNYTAIELWMKVGADAGGKLLIDLGKISEEVIPDGRLNSEDYISAGASGADGNLDAGEDIGLDGLNDADEQALYPGLGGDPSLDNFTPAPNWDGFNGTENSEQSFNGQFPDTEDLNNNSSLDNSNRYYRYEIDLESDLSTSPYFEGGGGNNDGWYLLRIPLSNPNIVIETDTAGNRRSGSVDVIDQDRTVLQTVEFIRLLVTDVATSDQDFELPIRIAEFNIVGSQWQEREPSDPNMDISVVSIEDNPIEYDSPPGVIRPVDRTRPDQQILGNEQSLALRFNNLPVQQVHEAYRVFPGEGLDLFNYDNMRMYLKFDTSTGLDPNAYSIVVKFGIDEFSYYEYRAPIIRGWHEVDIDFRKFAGLKTLIDETTGSTGYQPYTTPMLNEFYGINNAEAQVVGQPDAVQVRFISVGVVKTDPSVSGDEIEVWINELRVTNPKLDNGYAASASLDLKLADVANVALSGNFTDSYFHGISERFSSTRADMTNWTLNSNLNISKFFPEDWEGTQARVSYTHAESVTKPRLLPDQPDVEVSAAVEALNDAAQNLRSEATVTPDATERDSLITEAVRLEREANETEFQSQTVEIKDSWNISSFKLAMPGESFLIQDFINRLDFSYNYTTSRFRSPIYEQRKRWEWTFNAGYGYDFGRDLYVEPFVDLFDGVPVLETFRDAKWYILPLTNIRLSASLNRSRDEEIERSKDIGARTFRGFNHARQLSFNWVLSEQSLLNIDGSYNASLGSTLLLLETERRALPGGDTVRLQRQSSAIFGDMFFGRNGGLYFGEPVDFRQQVDINSRPAIASLFGLQDYTDLSVTYGVGYFWQRNIQNGNSGVGAGYNASLNATLNFRLKQWTDTWFDRPTDGGEEAGPGGPPGRGPRGGRRGMSEEKEEETEIPSPEEAKKLAEEANPELRREALIEKFNKEFEEMPEEDRTDPIKQAEFEERMQEAMLELDEQIRRDDSIRIAGGGGSGFAFDKLLEDLAYYAIKVPLLDFENTSFTFTQANNSQVSDLYGETGFMRFWSTNPFSSFTRTDNDYADFVRDASRGPNPLYMLGLISDPNPRSGSIGFQSSFPFVGIKNFGRGIRYPDPSLTFTDNYQHNNTLTLKTNRPLWEGARLDLNWDVKWSYNKNTQFRTNERGYQIITSEQIQGSYERTYLSFPDFFVFSAFNTNIENVTERFLELRADAGDTRSEKEKLAEAFEDGFEAFPWLSDAADGLIPRLNWGIRWDGLEKWAPLEDVADRITLEHRYNSNISTTWDLDQNTRKRRTQSKRTTAGFSPLIGINMGWDDIWDGNLNATVKWGKTSGYTLNTSSSNIEESSTDEINLTANFKKSGFEAPFLGLMLQNDIEFSLTFSYNTDRSRTYEISNLINREFEGQPREGTIRYTIEPRVRYSISSRVNASAFYSYQRTKPDSEVGSRIPGTTIHEAGIELRIRISG
ncbi:MAG: cell surface protein SprA [Ectothiorhodospiraceae bacterium]|nr:cell surface protein SprA [Ectothiorhodospiraceae bacterium]